MQRNEIVCDRCGETKMLRTKNDIIISFAKIDLWGIGQHRTNTPQRIDFCEKCYEEFINFLDGGAK